MIKNDIGGFYIGGFYTGGCRVNMILTHQSKPPMHYHEPCYRELCERPRHGLQALLDLDHWRNVHLQKGALEPHRCVSCSDGEFDHGW